MAVRGKNDTDILLAESFKELALVRPLDKITIKEITDKAGVIRPTFYNHFQDKYELLEWIVDVELLEPIKPLIENQMIDEALLLLLTGIEKEKDFYMQAVKLEGQNSFESIAKNCVKAILKEIIPESPGGAYPKFQWLTADIMAEYYAQSMCYVAIAWLKSGMSISAKEVAEIYQYIIRRSMNDMLAGYSCT